jgi:hypothetical protein
MVLCSRPPRRADPTASRSIRRPCSYCGRASTRSHRTAPMASRTLSCSRTIRRAQALEAELGHQAVHRRPQERRTGSLPPARSPPFHGHPDARCRDRGPGRVGASRARSGVHHLNVYAHAIPGGDVEAAELISGIVNARQEQTVSAKFYVATVREPLGRSSTNGNMNPTAAGPGGDCLYGAQTASSIEQSSVPGSLNKSPVMAE